MQNIGPEFTCKPVKMEKHLKISQISSVFFQWVYMYITSQNLHKVQTCSQKFAEGKRNWGYIVWVYIIVPNSTWLADELPKYSGQ